MLMIIKHATLDELNVNNKEDGQTNLEYMYCAHPIAVLTNEAAKGIIIHKINN